MAFAHRAPMKKTVLGIAVALATAAAWASGGDDSLNENTYTPQYHVPTAELQSYAADNARLVAPTYWRIYQFIAYRALTGHALSKTELDALSIDGWRIGSANADYAYASDAARNGVKAWMDARAAALGAGVKPAMKLTDAFSVEADAGDYAFFINCNRDALVRASQTLQKRLAQGGAQWAGAWLDGQDAVFANCSPAMPNGGQQAGARPRPLTMPPALPAKAPDWLVQDRAYQDASALFYAGRYDDARQRFAAIAKDAHSPWQSLGQYLAARSLIRKASVLPAPDAAATANTATAANKAAKTDPRTGLLTTARAELNALASSYAPAKALVNWIDVRLRPEERRAELSARLATQGVSASNVQDVADYLILLDAIEDKGMVQASDDMSAWIGAMQSSASALHIAHENDEQKTQRHSALAKARANWASKHAAQWLVAILANASASELTADETKAAAALKQDSPGYGMAQYYLARADLAGGKVADADAIITAMLDKPTPHSTHNRWLRMKMVTAKTPEAFVAAATRIQVENPYQEAAGTDGKATQPTAGLDDDFAQHITQHFSLEALKRYKHILPASEQKWINEMIWSRAVLLGDYATADSVTDELVKGRETTRPLYERFKKAATPADKKDAALLILANTPELVPYVGLDGGKAAVTTSYFWSCTSASQPIDDMGEQSPAFLTPELRTQADKEVKELRALPKRSTYLIPRIMEWAKQNKADPEAPKALHFLIASTRNECSAGADLNTDGNAKSSTKDKQAERNYSREAFQFLHAQFPKSEWTQKTKYFY